MRDQEGRAPRRTIRLILKPSRSASTGLQPSSQAPTRCLITSRTGATATTVSSRRSKRCGDLPPWRDKSTVQRSTSSCDPTSKSHLIHPRFLYRRVQTPSAPSPSPVSAISEAQSLCRLHHLPPDLQPVSPQTH